MEIKGPRGTAQDWETKLNGINNEVKPVVRELCTIMMVEKARERARIRESNKKKDLEIIEEALSNIEEYGLREVLMNSPHKYAPFATSGGQEELRRKYRKHDGN